MTDKKEFTSKQTEMLLELIEQYGGENKLDLRRDLRAFIFYDRMIFKQRIFAALKQIF